MQIQVEVRLFAYMAERAGVGRLTLELPDGATLAELRKRLCARHPGLRWPEGTMVAVNQEYAPESRVLRTRDEVAVIPPVSGG